MPIEFKEGKKLEYIDIDDDSELKDYLLNQRKKLGGFIPERKVSAQKLIHDQNLLLDFNEEQNRELSTTMIFVRILTKLMREKNLGENIVPIVPDEARTFGMDGLFRAIWNLFF